MVFRQEHHLLLEKLSALEKKVIVGGVDLLAKAEEQEKLLEESNNELEERRKRADQLRRELEEKEVSIASIEHLVLGYTGQVWSGLVHDGIGFVLDCSTLLSICLFLIIARALGH